MRASRPSSRAAMTLIEVMAGLTVMTMVLGLCVALITMLLRLSESGHRHASDEAALMRVARLFREDVRAANEVVAKGEGKRLWLGSASGDSVSYSRSRDGLLRVAWRGDEVVKEERLPLPAKSLPRFEVGAVPGRRVVALLVDRRQPSAGTEAKPRVLRVEATASANQRFSASGGDSR